ncbi:MAG: tetratricopeptide repeat protein [Myxococcaceae bacterium]|nr:tetratricopeptide repeat protein [Myxococcaceae bacterium]
MGRTPEEERLYEELSQAIETYENESKDFRREVQLLVEKKYEEKRNGLAQSYEKAIRDLEVLERKERLDAIAQFEEFLSRYEDDPASARYTPDVMFRLGELYYERSSDDHMLAMRDYEQRLRAIDPASDVAPPPEPVPDFGPSIALYRKLIAKFPDYKLNDGAWYLLGYCLEKQNQFEEGRQAYAELIRRYPKSRFTTEAWVRIGEYYFDAWDLPDSLEKAADAYEHAVKDTTHPLYDKALYKLAWTYYRMDRFDDAVAKFIALIDFYEQKAREKGEEEVGGDLRNEALQYTAISFADDKWGSLAKAQETFARLGGRRYEAEIYRRMGDVYFDQTLHAQAIEAYRLVLQKDPLAKDAPQIQQRIVQAYERDRKLGDAFREAEQLANMFGEKSAWYQKHKHDPDVIAAAEDLVEKNLYSTAVFHHQQALQYKKDGKFEEAKNAFMVAARSYETYLARFPRAKSAYELEFYLGECLYNSFQFAEAAKHWEAVRDSTADNKYQEEAAFSAVLAWQKQLEIDIKDGRARDLKVLKSSERPEGEKIEKIPMAETEQHLVAVSDAWLKRFPQHERSPGIAYKAAELFYVHNDFDEARRRFKEIVKSYPKNEVAQYATNLIVESYLVSKDWRAVEEVSAELASNKDVIDPHSELYKDLVRFKLAGRFKLADELMAQGKYEEAAQKYIALVDEEPHHEFADKALNNAAVAYENTRRFDSALKLYERIFREYPKSPLANSALFRVAVNAENSYDFDKAVANYQKLVDEYPTSEHREAALYNAARLLEAQQKYDESAKAFLRYADLFPDSEDAPKNQFRAALIYEKQEDWKKEIAALDEFVKKFSNKTAQVDLVVDARKRIGDAYQRLGDDKNAKKAYEAAADEFDKRGLKPNVNPVAAAAAAYSRFQLAEYLFKEFDKLKIGGRGKALERSFKAKAEMAKKVRDAYQEVTRYKNVEWTLAAFYRKGYVLERFGATILETPVPPELVRAGPEYVAEYQDALAQKTVALEDQAVESYIVTLTEARKQHISNEWTKRTLESLNRFRPKEYPVLKDPKPAFAQEMVYPEGLIPDPEGRQASAVPVQKLGGDEK